MKSYNPFKMFGTYVGLLCSLILIIDWGIVESIKDCLRYPSMISIKTEGWVWVCDSNILSNIFNNISLFLTILFIGFIIGWGIHSLIRRLK